MEVNQAQEMANNGRGENVDYSEDRINPVDRRLAGGTPSQRGGQGGVRGGNRNNEPGTGAGRYPESSQPGRKNPIEFTQSTDAMLQLAVHKLRNARKLPFSDQSTVDAAELIDLIERARHYLPKEIQNAHWLIEHNQELLASTRAQAEKMLQGTQQQMAQMIDEHEITQQAQQQAEQTVADATQKSREIHRQAFEYANETLGDLENQLTEMLVYIQKNRKALENS